MYGTIPTTWRPGDNVMLNVFYNTCEWLKNVADSELYTLKEFLEKMRELNNGEDVTYSIRSVKKKLQEYYGNHVFFPNFLAEQM